MAKKGGSEFGGEINAGSDAWNVADGYTKLKILRQLIMLDRWDTIAQFGTEEIDEDRVYDNNQLKKRRVEGLQRLHSTIKQLLGNVLFALKKSDQSTVRALVDRVKNIEEFIPKAFEEKEDLINHSVTFEINEDVFNKLIEILQDVKDQLNTPLNNAGLIFRPSEEIDLDKIMSEIIEGG